MKVLLERLLSCPTKLTPELFHKKVSVVGARLPSASLATLRTTLPTEAWLNIPRIKPILADPKADPTVRLLLLEYERIGDVPAVVHDRLREANVIEMVEHGIELTYDYWTADDILSASLPEQVVVPSGFEIVGHIAHLNLQEEHQPFKTFIGQVILDKNKSLRTVVAKVGTIDSKFRNFQMDRLAGDDDYKVTVRQGECRFKFDYSRVYWNTRLQHEHERLIKRHVKAGELVFDVFAGVGPFAIPASKAGAIVHANDLNPDSHSALLENIKLNKVKTVTAYCMDGRDFIKTSMQVSSNAVRRHYIMNLPALAPEFCDAFPVQQLLLQHHDHLIHCYMFCRPGEQCVDKIKLSGGVVEVVEEYLVRSVAPNKDMWCLTFCITNDQQQQQDSKRQRV